MRDSWSLHSGTYTAAVIARNHGTNIAKESNLNSDIGSNANGSYIKFANGFLICWYHGVVTDQTINNPYGTLFQGTRTMTFPIRFVSPPAATCSLFRWGASASWGTVSSCSASTCIIRGIDISVREAGTETEISYIAIGKWK